MRKDYIDFQSQASPVGYLLTFRTYGTWLHGDPRGSVDKLNRAYGTPLLPSNPNRKRFERSLLRQKPVTFGKEMRAVVRTAIEHCCTARNWLLWTCNVRTNHVHVVVTAACKPEAVVSAFKANATRLMRENGAWKNKISPWSYGSSKKYLWTETELVNAIAYVECDQGLPLP